MAARRNAPAPAPPIEPMLAKVAAEIPAAGGFLYEPKWDGFRAIVFRSEAGVFIQSRDLRPLDRYFPELHEVFLERLPAGCVIDGEIVIAVEAGLDFDALQLRLHPAASRVAMLAAEGLPLRPARGRRALRVAQGVRGGAPLTPAAFLVRGQEKFD